MIKLSTCHFPVSYLMVTLLQINHLLVRVLADFHINSNPFFLVLKPPQRKKSDWCDTSVFFGWAQLDS
jgi:hypothetical protein